jgi:hypothetical protein
MRCPSGQTGTSLGKASINIVNGHLFYAKGFVSVSWEYFDSPVEIKTLMFPN